MIKRNINFFISRLFFLFCSLENNCIFGNEFERFVHDRPQVIQAMMPDDVVWNWLDAKFKNTAGRPVYWNPISNHPGCSSISYEYNGKYYITIDNTEGGKNMDGEEMLYSVVFELFNASHRYEFAKLALLVEPNKIDCDEYLKQATFIEFETCQDITKFYYEVLIKNPSLETGRITYHKNKWVCYYTDFETYWKALPAYHDGYPECYRANYDFIKNSKPRHELGPPSGDNRPESTMMPSTK